MGYIIELIHFEKIFLIKRIAANMPNESHRTWSLRTLGEIIGVLDYLCAMDMISACVCLNQPALDYQAHDLVTNHVRASNTPVHMNANKTRTKFLEAWFDFLKLGRGTVDCDLVQFGHSLCQ